MSECAGQASDRICLYFLVQYSQISAAGSDEGHTNPARFALVALAIMEWYYEHAVSGEQQGPVTDDVRTP